MAITFNDFTSDVLDTRFMLPLWEFDFRIEYIPILLDDDSVKMVMNHVSGCVVDILRQVPACPLSALKVVPRTGPAEQSDYAESSYFTIANSSPVYDFVLQMGPTTFRMVKTKTTLQDVITTLPIFDELSNRLFRRGSTADPNAPTLLSMLGLEGRMHKVVFRFEHRIRVSTHITEGHREAENTELINKVIRTSADGGDHVERAAPILALQPEEIYRGDVHLSVKKTLNGRPRNLWLILEAPWNINKKDVDLTVDYRCGEGPELHVEDLTDWHTPLVTFYRDMVINRLFPALFFDINVEARLA